jgi:hypothetical protein
MTQQGALLRTGGALVSVETPVAGVREALLGLAAGLTASEPSTAEPDVTVIVDDGSRPPRTRDLVPVTRDVWLSGDGEVVLGSAGGSGFTQAWSVDRNHVTVRAWWAPSRAESAAAVALRSRFRALRAQVLVHYPALWWASLQGMAPLHVSVVDIDGVAILLAGPGGVGKSSLVSRELQTGAAATCDNLAACSATTAYGVLEPLRLPTEVDGAHGTRAAHGRRERPWRGHVSALDPELVVVVRRGTGPEPVLREVGAGVAARALVAGTFAAGELRRFWPLCAVLGLGTGLGPVLPRVEDVARTLTDRLPCFELELGREPGAGLAALLRDPIAKAYLEGARK